MPTGVQTRSSRRSTRKPGVRCIGQCCENVQDQKKSRKQVTKNVKVKKSNSKNENVSNKKTNSSSKINRKSSLLNETTREGIKSSTRVKSSSSLLHSKENIDKTKVIKNCVVWITPLPQEKLVHHFLNERRVKSAVDSKINKKGTKGSIHAVNKTEKLDDKKRLLSNKENVNIKIKPTALRSRRNVQESGEKINNKLLLNSIGRYQNGETDNEGKDKNVDAKSEITLRETNKTDKRANGSKKAVFNSKTKLPDNEVVRSEPATKLRRRKTFNYAESSLDSSIEPVVKENNLNKVPVYKQPIIENKTKKKRCGDLYEFDDSDENIRQKKKRKFADSSSDEYERTIKNILRNIANKVKKKRKKEIYSDEANNNLKTKQVKFATSTRVHKNNVTHGNVNEVKNSVTETSNALIPLKEIHEIKEQQQRAENNKINSTEENNVDGDDVNKAFEINNDKIEDNRNASSKIKIISNIQLQPDKELNLSIATPTKFRESRPKANSTMLSNVFSPWRFNEVNIKRNPHFLAIKPSSLPCISQEMVLDHSIVDKFEDLSRTPSHQTPQRKIEDSYFQKKTPVQKYVTDYFGDKNENKENVENTNGSLFDSDQFSPIKRYQFSNGVDIKSKILCEKNDNIIKSTQVQASTPKQVAATVSSALDLENSDDLHTNFGFSSDEEDNDQGLLTKEKDNKPFRVSVNKYDKKYMRQQKPVTQHQPTEFAIPSDDESEMSDLNDSEGRNNEEIKLFEDFDATDDLLKEHKFTKKKSKLRWLNDENPRYKKKKDVRTKEEEEEAEKWAAAFNSMCEEIEEFPLEIE